jgi:hypothetical protein
MYILTFFPPSLLLFDGCHVIMSGKETKMKENDWKLLPIVAKYALT